jgi:hypothetical protein
MTDHGGCAFHGRLPAVRARERGERGMQRSTERVPRVGFHTVAWVAILVGLLGSASPTQLGLLGRSPTLSSARYRVTLEAPQTIFQWQDAAVVVRMQNGQELPIDGILVVFQVDPPRAQYASIRPARARTEGGRVRAIVRSDLVGQVRITVRVGALTKRATITVVVPIATENGHADACRSRLEATDVLLKLT